MGQEYKITIAAPLSDASQIDFRLRRMPGFTNFDAQSGRYVFREPNDTGKMPNVVVKIENDGFYLCDFGGSSDAIIGALVRTLIAQFGELKMGDYEP